MFGLQIFNDMESLQREMDQLFRGLLVSPGRRAESPLSGVQWLDQGEAFSMSIPLPGIDVEKLDINIVDRDLTLSAVKSVAAPSEEVRWQRRERTSGSIRHAFRLPDKVDVEKVAAEYRNGILVINLPKEPVAQPRKIEVKAA